MVFGRVAGYVRFLLSYRRRVYALRKKYDRMREKADKQRNKEKRLRALKILDQAEPTIILLEEQNVSKFERNRMFNYVKKGILEAETAMKQDYKQEYAQEQRRK